MTIKANLALNLYVDERNLCAMSPWVQSAAWFSIRVLLLSWSAVGVWQYYRFESETDWHMRIGAAFRRHQLCVSHVGSFHRLLKCARKLGSRIRLQQVPRQNGSVLLFKQVSSKQSEVSLGSRCLKTNPRRTERPSLSSSDCERKEKSPTRPPCP